MTYKKTIGESGLCKALNQAMLDELKVTLWVTADGATPGYSGVIKAISVDGSYDDYVVISGERGTLHVLFRRIISVGGM